MYPPSCLKWKSGRDLCSTAQHFVYTSESSIQRSEQSVFVLGIADLHHQESIHHWQSDGIFHLLLHLDQCSMGTCSLQLLCPGSSSPIQTASDSSWHRDPNLQVKTSLRKCHTVVPNLRAIQPNSSHHSIHQNSCHRSIRHNYNHRSKKGQWYRHFPIREFLNLSLISSFQYLRDQFSMFCFCVNLWYLGSHFWFFWISLWIFPLFSLLLPLDHDLLCLPLPYDCLPVLLHALQCR